MVIENFGRTTRRIAAMATAAMVAGAGAVAASTPPSPVDEEAVAFLDTPVVDDVIAVAEGNSADCAALMAFMSAGLAAGFAMADEDGEYGEFAGELLFATSAPLLVPLLLRATPPTDAEQAAAMELITTELAGSIAELQELGLSQDDVLALQESLALSFFDVGDPADVEAADEAIAERFLEFVGHDFASISFLEDDGIGGGDDDALPWEESCPETVALFEFDMDPVTVTMDFEVVITVPAETTETTEPGA